MTAAPPSTLRALAAVALAAAVAACATPGGPAEEPDRDKRFYEARCGVCHVPYPREHYEPEDWPGVVDDMGPRAGLTRSQRRRVLDYLTAR
jgi:hypothetical protein